MSKSRMSEEINDAHRRFSGTAAMIIAAANSEWPVFQAARKSVSEAHNRQEKPLFARRIELKASRRK